jgi:hypothetical protein
MKREWVGEDRVVSLESQAAWKMMNQGTDRLRARDGSVHGSF